MFLQFSMNALANLLTQSPHTFDIVWRAMARHTMSKVCGVVAFAVAVTVTVTATVTVAVAVAVAVAVTVRVAEYAA